MFSIHGKLFLALKKVQNHSSSGSLYPSKKLPPVKFLISQGVPPSPPTTIWKTLGGGGEGRQYRGGSSYSMGEFAKKPPKLEKNTYKVEILHRVRGKCQETHIKSPHLQHLGITLY